MKNKLILLMTLLLVAGIATEAFAEPPRNRLKQGSYVKNRRRLGEILVEYRLVRAVTIYAYPDETLGFFIEAGRNVYVYDIKGNIKEFKILPPSFQFLTLLA